VSPDALKIAGITKRYGLVQVLQDVDFSVRHGEIHALLGTNGAGKSTLLKIVAGAITADAGTISVDGQPVVLDSVAHSRAAGIGIAHQELVLAENLTVAENIFVGTARHGVRGFVSRSRLVRLAQPYLDEVGFRRSASTVIGQLGIADRQLVEIARLLAQNPAVLLLDEPTSALAEDEAERLFEILRALRAEGRAIVFVSHRLREVTALADRVTVLNGGRTTTATAVTDDGDEHQRLVRLMLGEQAPSVPSGGAGREPSAINSVEPVLIARELTTKGHLISIDLAMRPGEILGVIGLKGSGRSTLARTLFGLHPIDSGELTIAGRRVTTTLSPRLALRLGVAFIPEDRQREGIVALLSVASNINLSSRADSQRFSFVLPRAIARKARKYQQALGITAAYGEGPAGWLSGGNQQKIVLARALSTRARVLLLDDPTRGVDVGAKADIHRLIAEQAASGVAVLLISSEFDEVFALSDRVIALRNGRLLIERELRTQDDQSEVLRAVYDHHEVA
jgi:ABC-type sugar transport system ATPase subunit